MALRFNALTPQWGCWVKRLVPAVLVSIAFTGAVHGADDKTPFLAKPASEYPHKMTSEKVTIAAQTFITDEEAKEPFGKLNPWRYGVLPVLVVIQNDGPNTLRVDRASFVYVLPDRSKVESTPAAEIRFLQGPKQPQRLPSQAPPLPFPKKGKASPLAAWEIEGRAFAAKVIPPGQSASGFIYFQAPTTSDAASLYVSGLFDAVTRAELYYFDIPMSGK